MHHWHILCESLWVVMFFTHLLWMNTRKGWDIYQACPVLPCVTPQDVQEYSIFPPCHSQFVSCNHITSSEMCTSMCDDIPRVTKIIVQNSNVTGSLNWKKSRGSVFTPWLVGPYELPRPHQLDTRTKKNTTHYENHSSASWFLLAKLPCAIKLVLKLSKPAKWYLGIQHKNVTFFLIGNVHEEIAMTNFHISSDWCTKSGFGACSKFGFGAILWAWVRALHVLQWVWWRLLWIWWRKLLRS